MSSFIPIYNALHWRKLKNHDDEDLPQEDVLKLWGFYNMMKWTRGCSFVMRGESNGNLVSLYDGREGKNMLGEQEILRS